jgi:hypothetical protein
MPLDAPLATLGMAAERELAVDDRRAQCTLGGVHPGTIILMQQRRRRPLPDDGGASRNTTL